MSVLRTYHGSGDRVGAEKTARANVGNMDEDGIFLGPDQGIPEFEAPISKLHSIIYKNESAVDHWIYMFDISSSSDVPASGTRPDYPPYLVPPGMTTGPDWGDSGLPMTEVGIVISSTENTLTIVGGSPLFLLATYS
jgi:hypothetical protein